MTLDPELPASFWLEFKPNVELVTVVRRFVSAFYDNVLQNPDVSDRLAMATHELLENAVKYCSDGGTVIAIDVSPPGGVRHVCVRTQNRSQARDREALSKAMDRIHAAADPEAHYRKAMLEIAKRPVGSGLGLVRIRCEGGMDLSLEIEDDLVRIAAQTQITEEEAP